MVASLSIDGAAAAALAERHGTPFYLYDMDAALAQLFKLRAALPSSVEIFYSVKANANRKLLAAFRPHLAGLDLSSAGELDLAVACGYSPETMSFAGPGKTEAELHKVIDAGLHLLSLESIAELGRAAAVARQLGRRQDVTLRINPLAIPGDFAMRMGGGPSQFGVPEEEAGKALHAIAAEPRVRLRGLHVYAGTQCLEPKALVDNLIGTLEIARRLAQEHDLRPAVLNLGGGLGIPYFEGQQALDVDAVGHALGDTLRTWQAANPRFGGTRFLLELGRFLIGPYGVYVARVTEVKETRGKRYVILDGGMNHCFPATGNFGQIMKKNYPVANLSRGGALEPQELCGPLCTPMDSMARGLQMARAEPGDLIGFFASGAYSYSASPLLFLSHDTPPELVRLGGQVAVGRERMPATRFL